MDLDQSGRGFQRVRTYLGPSLGWTDELVQPTTELKTAGVYNVTAGDSVILVNVAAGVTIQLPDVRLWVQQTANQPATGFERSITVKDLGGNAGAFNIIISPFSQQFIDNVQQAVVISVARSALKLIPLIDLSGWAVALASSSGGGIPGGGDVFKAGNNTFTGTNIFLGATTVVTTLLSDNSTHVATTEYVKGQAYITGDALVPYALIASPTFTGVPKAPTPVPSADDNTIVTVGFVENALAGFSGGAPVNAEYLLGTAHPSLPGARTVTNTATIVWDLSTPGQVKASTAVGGGNVSNSGTPVTGQLAKWVTPTTIQGVDASTLGFQPLDGDLTTISGLTGTNTIYYRSAAEIWSPVTFSGLSFSGGVLSVTGGGGTVQISGTPIAGQVAEWTNATTIKGVSNVPHATSSLGIPPSPNNGDLWYDLATGALSIFINDGNTSQWVQIAPSGSPDISLLAPIASPTFTGDPKAPTPAPGDNDTTVATTAFVMAALAAGGGGGGGFTTGDVKITLKVVADTGWVMMNDGTIGSPTSGASRANADTQNLFNLLYDNYSDANCQVLTSGGTATTRAAQGTSATAFTSNCRMSLPKVLGRALAVSGTGAGLSGKVLGQAFGEENHVLSIAELAAHAHGVTDGTHTHNISDPTHAHSVTIGGPVTGLIGVANVATNNWEGTGVAHLASASVTVNGNATGISIVGNSSNITIQNNGSGTGHNTIQPTTYLNVMVKL